MKNNHRVFTIKNQMKIENVLINVGVYFKCVIKRNENASTRIFSQLVDCVWIIKAEVIKIYLLFGLNKQHARAIVPPSSSKITLQHNQTLISLNVATLRLRSIAIISQLSSNDPETAYGKLYKEQHSVLCAFNR